MNLRSEVKSAIEICMANKEPFTILTLTNKMKIKSHSLGEGIIRHREVRPLAEEILSNEIDMSVHGYIMSRITVNVNGTPVNGVRLYHCDSYDPLDYVDTNQVLWEPPGGWRQRNIQIDATFGDSDPKVHKVQRHRLILELPQSFVKSKFKPNETVGFMKENDHLTVGPIGGLLSKFKLRVTDKGRLRLFGKALRMINKKPGEYCHISSLGSNVVIW